MQTEIQKAMQAISKKITDLNEEIMNAKTAFSVLEKLLPANVKTTCITTTKHLAYSDETIQKRSATTKQNKYKIQKQDVLNANFEKDMIYNANQIQAKLGWSISTVRRFLVYDKEQGEGLFEMQHNQVLSRFLFKYRGACYSSTASAEDKLLI